MTEARIQVERVGDLRFSVRITDNDSETSHDVTISQADLARLGTVYATPEALVGACFEFMLAREPKESILRSFDVSVISTYFPEFEREITRTDVD